MYVNHNPSAIQVDHGIQVILGPLSLQTSEGEKELSDADSTER